MKVLIISHNPISTQSNMGITFLSHFSKFEKEELCQLYIYPTLPNTDRCASYYRVTDKEALRSIATGRKIGRELRPEEIQITHGAYENASDEAVYRNRKNKRPLRKLLRDTVWKMSGWFNKNLQDWLDKEKPECIYVAPGSYKFIYDFAITISEKCRIPIVTYLCDEIYFVEPPLTLVGRIQQESLKRRVESLMKKTSCLMVISEEMRALYAEHFGINVFTLMTGGSIPISDTIQVVKDPVRISYFGNIRCNRYLSLAQIGQALDELNMQYGRSYELHIYTAEKNQEILDHLTKHQSIVLHGFLSGNDFEKAMKEAQLLLHVEDFCDDSVNLVRHSISTKIANSLASGIPLLAYGPEGISSMQHLIRNQCAIVATKNEDLLPMLLQAFTDDSLRKQVAQKALQAAQTYHTSETVSGELRQIIRETMYAASVRS